MIRLVEQEDKEWLLNIAEKAYSGTKFGWVRKDAESTFTRAISQNNCLVIRGEKTFLFAFLSPRLCDYSKMDAYMELLVGEGGAGTEPLLLLHEAKKWAIFNKVQRFTISSVTEHKFGKRIMKILGAVPRTVYDINN